MRWSSTSTRSAWPRSTEARTREKRYSLVRVGRMSRNENGNHRGTAGSSHLSTRASSMNNDRPNWENSGRARQR